jgi:hypothetical protein
MSERIREIRFLHFRGLPNYLCPLKGKSLVVLAGNGKGKSGIVALPQAKDFVSGLKALTKRCQDNQLIKGVGG